MKQEQPLQDTHGAASGLGLVAVLIVGGLIIVIGCDTARREPRAARDATPATPAEPPPIPTAEDEPSNASAVGDATRAGEPPTPAPSVEVPEPPPNPFRAQVQIENMADPQEGWLRIHRQSVSGGKSTAEGRYEPVGDFTIDTVNVDGFTLDRAALAVPRSQRLIMHIDGQNLVVYPREQGLVTFRRSPTGVWEYARPPS